MAGPFTHPWGNSKNPGTPSHIAPIAAAVEKKQFFLLIDGEPARIGDTRVIVR
jgi:hypothetical protein